MSSTTYSDMNLNITCDTATHCEIHIHIYHVDNFNSNVATVNNYYKCERGDVKQPAAFNGALEGTKTTVSALPSARPSRA